MPRGRLWLILVILSTANVLLTGCRGADPKSPAERIRGVISTAEQAVEQRDVGALRDIVGEKYKDSHGYDKSSVVRLIHGYLLRNRTIYLFSKITDIVIVDDTHASVQLLVAMAGRRVQLAEELLGVRADVLYFDLDWLKINGKWEVTASTWRRARVEDFFRD